MGTVAPPPCPYVVWLTDSGVQRSHIIRVVLVTALVLLVSLVAMQFSDEVDWNFADFAIVGTLLIGTGLLYELAARKTRNVKQRAAIGVVLGGLLLLVWAELAVGVFGTPIAGS